MEDSDGFAQSAILLRKKLNVPDNKSGIYYQQKALTKRDDEMH